MYSKQAYISTLQGHKPRQYQSLPCSREPDCQSHLCPDRSNHCSWTHETYTDKSRNSFTLCQMTTYSQLEGDSPSKSRGNILFPTRNRSQRRHKTWHQAGAYEAAAWQGACPREAWSPSTTTGGSAESPPHGVCIGREIDCTAELGK